MRLFFLGVFLPLVVTGCATAQTKQPARDIDTAGESSELRANSDRAVQGLAFAQIHCAGCHGIEDGQVSANDKAPRFEAIANVRGLTENTLKSWLRNSHNYPGQMDFEIDTKRIDDLAAYMLTLRSPDYRPPIQ